MNSCAGASSAFDHFSVVPPATGIVHQVNLEFLAKGVLASKDASGKLVLFPDTLVGTDSHTTMINGLGVLGWGVGGIEAEAAMLGQPYYMLAPDVVGFKLKGKLREGVTATDLVLTVTQMLRKKGVVGQIRRILRRRPLANGPPRPRHRREHVSRIRRDDGILPRGRRDAPLPSQTARTEEEVDRVERYTKEQGIFRTDQTPDPEFTDTLELNLETVEPSLAGPKRPQDRIPLSNMKIRFRPNAHRACEGSRFRPVRGRSRAQGDGAHATARDARSATAPSSSPRSPPARTPRIRR